jgi:hypothetical protein
VKVSTKPLLLSRKDKIHQECKWEKMCTQNKMGVWNEKRCKRLY